MVKVCITLMLILLASNIYSRLVGNWLRLSRYTCILLE